MKKELEILTDEQLAKHLLNNVYYKEVVKQAKKEMFEEIYEYNGADDYYEFLHFIENLEEKHLGK